MTDYAPDPGNGTVLTFEERAAFSAAKRFTGSDAPGFSSILISQVCSALWLGNSTPDERQSQMQSCLTALEGVGPQNAVEGILAAQMVALHNAMMECCRRAMVKDQTFESRRMNLSFAAKLSRAFALHLETLDKHRGKGQQVVRVEHVTVNAGGQAIVGNLQSGAGGSTKSEDQPHAQSIAHAPEPAMRSPFEAEREALSVRRDGKR